MQASKNANPVRLLDWFAICAYYFKEFFEGLPSSYHVHNVTTNLDNQLLRKHNPGTQFVSEDVSSQVVVSVETNTRDAFVELYHLPHCVQCDAPCYYHHCCSWTPVSCNISTVMILSPFLFVIVSFELNFITLIVSTNLVLRKMTDIPSYNSFIPTESIYISLKISPIQAQDPGVWTYILFHKRDINVPAQISHGVRQAENSSTNHGGDCVKSGVPPFCLTRTTILRWDFL